MMAEIFVSVVLCFMMAIFLVAFIAECMAAYRRYLRNNSELMKRVRYYAKGYCRPPMSRSKAIRYTASLVPDAPIKLITEVVLEMARQHDKDFPGWPMWPDEEDT